MSEIEKNMFELYTYKLIIVCLSIFVEISMTVTGVKLFQTA